MSLYTTAKYKCCPYHLSHSKDSNLFHSINVGELYHLWTEESWRGSDKVVR